MPLKLEIYGLSIVKETIILILNHFLRNYTTFWMIFHIKNTISLSVWKCEFLGFDVILTLSDNSVVLQDDVSNKSNIVIFYEIYVYFRCFKFLSVFYPG